MSLGWYGKRISSFWLMDFIKIICTSHDYISDFYYKKSGKKFKSFKEWNQGRWQTLIQDVIAYADYVDKAKSEKDEQLPTAAPILLGVGPRNLPLLPTEKKGVRGSETADDAKKIIRAYFTRHYRAVFSLSLVTNVNYRLLTELASGSDHVKVPWQAIATAPTEYFEAACLPDGFQFNEPSRMGFSAKILLDHLRLRQGDLGVKAFEFHHVLRNGQKLLAEYPSGLATGAPGY